MAEVDGECDAEHDEERERVGRKRELPGGTVEEARAKRHENYLKKATSGANEGSWRPRAINRLAAKRWCCGLDNQLRASTGHSGLSVFAKPEEQTDMVGPWSSWRSWPYISISMDLGSDGNCGYHSLERHFAVNCDQFNDPNHGCNRDYDLAVKSVGLWGFALCVLIHMNLPFGPQRNDQRRHEIRTIMERCYAENEAPEQVPLFRAYALAILKGLRRANIDLPCEGDPELEAWRHLRTRSFGVPEGRRVNLSRFLGFPAALSRKPPDWHLDCFERTYVSLEMDFMGNKGVQDKIFMRATDAENIGEHNGTTSSAKVCLDDKIARSCAKNAVAISVLVTQDDSNYRLAQILAAGGEPLVQWNTEQNLALRTADGGHRWLKEQACGKYVKHVMRFPGMLVSEASLESCGFATTPMQCKALADDVRSEDEFADMLAQFVVSLANFRFRRHLPLTSGYPHSLIRVVGMSEGEASIVLGEFKEDFDIFTELRRLEDKPLALQTLFKRHTMRKVSNQQCILAMQESDWKPFADFEGMLVSRTKGIFATQAVEDVIGYEKNNKAGLANRRFRRPLFSMFAALKSGTLTQRHKFKGVSMEVPLRSKSERIAPDAFKENPRLRSLEFKDIAGVAPNPPWFSPVPQNNGAPTADLFTLRACWRSPRGLAAASDIKANELFRFEHRFVYRHKSSDDDQKFFLPLSAYPGSAILVLPCIKRTGECHSCLNKVLGSSRP